jgi:serine/threonine-protein kinase
MSRVFLAEETSLGRRVVVKLLPADLSGGVSIARFRREIALAATLQHPHIVPLLSAGEIGGLPYYTMPFVEGESLRARLAHGELSIADTISILRDVAKALDYAHGKGVAHRDIKPDNVLVAGTTAVVTDFGVAKAISQATAASSLTSIGVALGTPAYMAPEQAAADPATDVRADYYAFGAMAFEMLAGHPPFAGRTPQSMLAAHATETPPLIGTLRPATPPLLAELVMRCLEKRPGDRPQSAVEILRILDAIGPTDARSAPIATPISPGVRRSRLLVAGLVVVALTGTAVWWSKRVATSGAEIRTIAILPFENASHDTTFDYLGDGIPDHVRDALNALPQLTVKARSSSRQVKGLAARDIGTKLGVSVVLQGTVSRSNAGLHVTAELVRTADESSLWSATLDGAANDIAAVQDSIAHSVIRKLRLPEPGQRSSGPGARGTTDAAAYDLFLRGRFADERFDFARAESLYKLALVRDPRFARALGRLAIGYSSLPLLGAASADSSLALARATADRAIAIDSTVVEPYIAQSNVLAGEWRLADAIKPLERALTFDSTDAEVLSVYAFGLAQIGRVDDALGQVRRAREYDPLSLMANGIFGYILGLARRFDEAVAQTKAAIEIAPRVMLPTKQLGMLYAFKGLKDSAVATLEAAFTLDSSAFGGRSNLVFGYALVGRWDDVARQRTLLAREATGSSRNYHAVITHLVYGEYDSAMTSLERGVAERDQLMAAMSVPCDPLFDPLKSNPRFAVLMQRIGARACPATVNWPAMLPPRPGQRSPAR